MLTPHLSSCFINWAEKTLSYLKTHLLRYSVRQLELLKKCAASTGIRKSNGERSKIIMTLQQRSEKVQKIDLASFCHLTQASNCQVRNENRLAHWSIRNEKCVLLLSLPMKLDTCESATWFFPISLLSSLLNPFIQAPALPHRHKHGANCHI
jgi:hypothetical protein